MQAIYVWALPDTLMTPPAYHRGHFDAAASAGGIHCLVGRETGALPARQDLALHRLVSVAGKNYTHPAGPQRGTYLFMLEGAAEIGGTRLERRDSIGLAGADRIEIAVTADDTDLLLVETAL